MSTPPSLPPAPRPWVDAHGAPCFGTYAGELEEVNLAELGAGHKPGLAASVLRRKRWHYSLIGTPEVLVVTAVADVGYAANAFLAAVDLGKKELLVDESFLGVPGPLARVNDHPGQGLACEFWGLGGHFHTTRGSPEARYTVEADTVSLGQGHAQLRASVLVAGGPPALSVIAPVPEGIVNVTQKHAGLLAFGTFQAKGRTYSLDGGVAGMDYTQGLLARHTSWRWAMGAGRLADGTPLGFNLVEGFNVTDERANENALWVGKELIALARAKFEWNRTDPLQGWHVTTNDGAVDLSFTPFHVHRDVRDLKVIKSKFLQPLGVFSGTVRVGGQTLAVERLPGVTEDQEMVW